MDQVVEVKIVGWLQLGILVAIILLSYFFNRGEIRITSVANRNAVDRQSKDIEALRQQIRIEQEGQRRFCLQYQQDMDSYFRSKPEFKYHPWVCEPLQ